MYAPSLAGSGISVLSNKKDIEVKGEKKKCIGEKLMHILLHVPGPPTGKQTLWQLMYSVELNEQVKIKS